MKNYYVLSNGRIRRHQNTIWIEAADGTKKPIPVEDVDSLYVYGEVDVNTRVLNFLSQKRIPLHVFNYYGFYSGSFYPREFLHSGYLVVEQVSHYKDDALRLALAREIVRGAAHSLLRNVAYYARRRAGAGDPETDPPGEIAPVERVDSPPESDAVEESVDAFAGSPGDSPPDSDSLVRDGRLAEGRSAMPFIGVEPSVPTPSTESEMSNASDMSTESTMSTMSTEPTIWETAFAFDAGEDLSSVRATIEALALGIDGMKDVNALRGIEGKIRQRYYASWRSIIRGDWAFERRVRRPPDNEVNALISFGNGVLYTACLAELYRTQLTPTISYLHEPGARRFSLALDLSELFKPLIVDRAIFRLLNTNQLEPSHFDKSLDGCFLTETGKRLFLGSLEERLTTTIRHRRLNRHVSYRHLIRLECYKLIRHLTGVETYRAFRAWW